MKLELFQEVSSKNKSFIHLLTSEPSTHYKVYKIPKRTYGFRTIAQPSPAVKQVQKLIVEVLSNKVQLHPCATAYIAGMSIKANAQRHVNSTYLLKIDIENFFNSITPSMLKKALVHQGIILDKNDYLVIKQCLFWNRSKESDGKLVLSVGAPSSPFVSNLVMYSFDSQLSELCKENNITYTRYADDLTFSTNQKNILFKFINEIEKLLKEEFGLDIVLNESKTVFSSKAHNRHVTGITLTNNNKLSIGREKKRYISALIHKYSHKKLEEHDIYHLKGLISHALFIEKEFIQRMCKKYGYNTLKSIKRYPSGD